MSLNPFQAGYLKVVFTHWAISKASAAAKKPPTTAVFDKFYFGIKLSQSFIAGGFKALLL
jgi:hypothetical protein